MLRQRFLSVRVGLVLGAGAVTERVGGSLAGGDNGHHATAADAPDGAHASEGVPSLPGGAMSFEPKWDGFRAMVFRDGEEVGIGSRNGKSMTRYFPELMGPLKANLPSRCVIDGEIILVAASGDFTAWPFREGRAALARALADSAAPIQLTAATRDRDAAVQWLRRFEGAGLDGLVAKPLAGLYHRDKRVMFKIKHERTADCVLAGYRVHGTGPGLARSCWASTTTPARSATLAGTFVYPLAARARG